MTSLSFPGELPLECASEAKLVDPRAALGTLALDNGARLEGAPKDVDPGILSFAYQGLEKVQESVKRTEN